MVQNRFSFSLLVLAFVSAFQVACSPKKNETTTREIQNVVRCDGKADIESFGIMGGQTLSAKSKLAKGVVYIVTSYYDRTNYKLIGEGACTGALIDSNIVLTAAHCFDTSGIEGVKSSDLVFLVNIYKGFRPFCQLNENINGIQADRVVVHKNFFEKEGSGDIALLRLREIMPGEHTHYPLEAQTHDFAADEALVAVGYGKTVGYSQKESSDRPLKVGFLRSNKDPDFRSQILDYFDGLDEKLFDQLVVTYVEKQRTKALKEGMAFGDSEEEQARAALRQMIEAFVAASTPKFEYSNEIENLVFDQSKSDGVCAGDSGGPGLRQQGDSLRIVGVAQAVFSYKNLIDQCSYGSVYTNVAYHKEWIIEKFNQLANDKTTVHRNGTELFH